MKTTIGFRRYWGPLNTFFLLGIIAPVMAVAPPVVPDVRLAGGITALEDVGIYGVSYRYTDGRTGAMPVGWTGDFEETTGIACRPFGMQNGKRAFMLHPIWRGGTGDTDQTFHLRLPAARQIRLGFSIAMREGFVGPGKSDGATFRVFVNERVLLDTNKIDAVWSDYHFDLTRYAGQSITLRFETDPGPRGNSSFDFALWGDRQISVVGSSALKKVDAIAPSANGVAFSTRLSSMPAPFLEGWTAVHQGKSRVALGFGGYLRLVAPDGRLVRSDAPEVTTRVQQTPVPDKSS